jgi:hypothetical protein
MTSKDDDDDEDDVKNVPDLPKPNWDPGISPFVPVPVASVIGRLIRRLLGGK